MCSSDLTLDDCQDLVGGLTKANSLVQSAYECSREAPGYRFREVAQAAHVDDEDGQIRVVLRGQRSQYLLEPEAGITGYDYRYDRGSRRLGFGLHPGVSA